MISAKEVLSKSDYSNYRNVRAASVLFVVLGSILFLAGILLTFVEDPEPDRPPPPAFFIGLIAVAGLAGAVGGFATLLGNRQWAPLVYGMAVLYVFAFPLGTILSIVLMTGLWRYLDSVERVREAKQFDASLGAAVDSAGE